jgi:hypothetical protein
MNEEQLSTDASQIRTPPMPVVDGIDAVISVNRVAEIVVDLWRIAERAKAEGAGPRVIASCERAEDRIKRLGFEVDPMLNQLYDTNLKVRVVDHEESEGPVIITNCISPAVKYGGVLVREAEIITKGLSGAK